MATRLAPAAALALALVLLGVRSWSERVERAAAYGEATAALERGDLAAASAGFAALGTFRDADARRAAIDRELEPLLDAVEAARQALRDGEIDRAIDGLTGVLAVMPSLGNARALLDEARERRGAALLGAAATAERAGDWLELERALAELAAAEPGDERAAARLADVRRERAPLVYARNGVIYVAEPSGANEEAVTPPMDALLPIWSPDRRRIAFLQHESSAGAFDGLLYVVDADGSGLRRLATRVLPFFWPEWSPDGTKLAYSTALTYDETINEGHISIAVYDLAADRETILTGDHQEQAFAPTWAPDGSRLAFVSLRLERRRDRGSGDRDNDVFVVDADGKGLVDVTRDRIDEEGWVFWSPAGDRLLVFTTSGDWGDPRRSEIVLLDVGSWAITKIPTHDWSVEMPVWSPDGRRFAYVEDDHVVRIWSESGERWVRAETALSSFLSWSPDGSAIFAASSDERNPSYIVPVDEGFGAVIPTNLGFQTSLSDTGPPQWSPRTQASEEATRPSGGTALDKR